MHLSKYEGIISFHTIFVGCWLSTASDFAPVLPLRADLVGLFIPSRICCGPGRRELNAQPYGSFRSVSSTLIGCLPAMLVETTHGSSSGIQKMSGSSGKLLGFGHHRGFPS